MQITAFYLLSLVFACLTMLLWQLPEGFRIGDVTAVRAAYYRVGLVFGLTPALALSSSRSHTLVAAASKNCSAGCLVQPR